ncbi:MAG: class I SAM-dependent methyltransferase [Chloroflexi bacterium]|nr:class I SAM-dependent methyltransferase [Chloroflexota bacterium]
MTSNHVCPVCKGSSVHEREVAEWGEMRRCPSCDLVFAYPMTLPEPPESLFNKAYQGVAKNVGMKEYGVRMSLKSERKRGRIDPKRVLFWGAYDQAMAWFQKNVPKGSVVLDIGCGVGYWISTLRQEGYDSAGLDVAKSVVDMLSAEGFDMWHGTVESLDPNWKNPSVVTSFFVMHHLQDPIGFLKTIRKKFPEATLMIGVWNQFPEPLKLSPASLPPRTLAWWGPKSLKTALEKAGYEVDIISETIGAAEFEMPGPIRRLIPGDKRPGLYYKLLSAYYWLKPAVFLPWKLWKRKSRSGTALAICRPR